MPERPPTPPPGGGWSPPLPPDGDSGSRRPSSRVGYPPATPGLLRSASQGSIQDTSGRAASPEVGLVRSSSSGALRPGSGLGARGARAQLEPLPDLPQVAPAVDTWVTPRETNLPRLTPLSSPATPTAGGATGSRPGTGDGKRERTPLSGSKGLIPPAFHSTEALGLAFPAPPVPSLDAGAVRRSKDAANVDDSNASTARGPVKWVPHTHANPKHAKFCFICLHGRLEGEKDGIDEDMKKKKAEDQDLPSPVEMKELAYLVSSPSGQNASEGRFRRAGADFDCNNITALWLREVTDRVYDETIQGMVAEQNTGIALGVDVKLVDEREDEGDRKELAKLFTLSKEENAKLDDDMKRLGDWCTSVEPKLLDVMPAPRELGKLPEVEKPTAKQLELLAYEPLIDLSRLRGETAADARIAMLSADAAMGSSKFGGNTIGTGKNKITLPLGFKVEDLPEPLTHADMAEVQIVPYPLTVKDVPPYEPLRPPKPTRKPVDALTDPFQRPFLYMADFHEAEMPAFEGTSNYGKPRSADPVAAKEEWLSKTRSIFPDNNDPTEEHGWGYVPERKVPVPVLIDEPYLPPFDVVGAEGGGKKLMLRGIWDPELFDTSGQMVPPLADRGKGLYEPITIEHPDKPVWSTTLAPQQSAEDKVNNLIPIIPVRSYRKFRPKKVEVEIPEFLWDVVRVDAAGQGLWDVISQRHEIAKEEREAEERRRAAVQKDLEEERLAIAKTLELEAEGAPNEEDGGSPKTPTPAARRKSSSTPTAPVSTADASSPSRRPKLVENVPGLPQLEVEPPATPQASSKLPVPAGTSEAPAVAAATFGATASSSSAGPPTVTLPIGRKTLQPGAAASSDDAAPLPLKDQEERVRSLVQRGGEGRKVEELLADDRFLDNLADKITLRLGAAAATGTFDVTINQGAFANTASMSKSQMMNSLTLTGQPGIKRPDQPSFAEPSDPTIKAQLPRALQGISAGETADNRGIRAANAAEASATSAEVNSFTQEKMRGDCYVRLLVHPDANAGRKDIVPYQGETLVPDISLVMGANRPHLSVPPKKPYVNEEGEIVEDDEFMDFEKHDIVAFSFVRHNRYEALEAIIQQEIEILSSKDESGNNLLHIACQNDHRRIAKMLLKNGIEVNAQNKKGNTPLHYCFQYKFSQLAEYLIAHGADESIPNKNGFLPTQGTGAEDNVGVAQKGLR